MRFLLGASYYIMKPFDHDMLLSRIRSLKEKPHRKRPEGMKMLPYEAKADYLERNLETGRDQHDS